jgi:hypothetical protein
MVGAEGLGYSFALAQPSLVENAARKLPVNLLYAVSLGCLRLAYRLNSIEDLAKIALRDLNVIVVLQIEPKLWRCAECLGEPKRSIGGNAGLFARDMFSGTRNSSRRDAWV